MSARPQQLTDDDRRGQRQVDRRSKVVGQRDPKARQEDKARQEGAEDGPAVLAANSAPMYCAAEGRLGSLASGVPLVASASCVRRSLGRVMYSARERQRGSPSAS